MTSTPAPTPRKQSERRKETIAQLIDATIACLVELGYAHTTTQAIASRAGLSQGAIFRHYPTRQDLLIAAAEVLSDRFHDDFKQRIEKAQGPQDTRVEMALTAMSEVISSPNQIAWFELQLAARTDAALCEAFQPIFKRNQQGSIELAQMLLPDLIAHLPMASEVVQALIHMFHGVTLDAHIEQDAKKQAQMLSTTIMFAKMFLAQWQDHGRHVASA